MKPDFATTLCILRRESSLSQKKAADDLGVSQALLSHYENGVREPKLEFIMKASDYYGVTTDYILGRTVERSHDGIALRCSREEGRRNADAAALLIDLLTVIDDGALSESAARYMSFCLYFLISALRAPDKPYDPLFDAALKTAEADFMANVRRTDRTPERMTTCAVPALEEKYPERIAAVRQLEEAVETAVSGMKRWQETQ